jgi:hypothetical protein
MTTTIIIIIIMTDKKKLTPVNPAVYSTRSMVVGVAGLNLS